MSAKTIPWGGWRSWYFTTIDTQSVFGNLECGDKAAAFAGGDLSPHHLTNCIKAGIGDKSPKTKAAALSPHSKKRISKHTLRKALEGVVATNREWGGRFSVAEYKGNTGTHR